MALTTAVVLGTCALGSVAVADGDDDDDDGGGRSARLRASLDGGQEVPPADPDGDGRARVRINAGKNGDEVCFDLRWDDIGTPTLGHIHKAPAGVNGPIVVTFFHALGLPATDPLLDRLERGRLEDCVDVADDALLADIVANPAQYYVNIHNARFPGGAIRGQLGG